ncbi:substrate-binding periplasmic protein [Parendozoicomonas haliclonae]|uniref:Bacterial extracellular solute-binding protein, family 3 n=1 Tax=Parendozoicomonas haliclonae TaxID=1960125 RepID=A0A1X7AII6_9GAMM|nr:transporter substrate-binding domain-containing protein [Parendozoicomonas haliclonae]SMA45328.1 Bacterial extracellular solute-binding protein, family 3 [Parendozoicomonas haliclonae]
MSWIKRKWVGVVAALLFSGQVLAESEVSLQELNEGIRKRTLSFAAPMWEGYTHKDGTGLYWEILKEVYTPLGFKVRLQNMPFNRSMKMLTKLRKIEGVPGEGHNSDFSNITYSKYPLEPEYLAIAYRKGAVASFEKTPDLTGKTVGMRKGYALLDNPVFGKFKVKEAVTLGTSLQHLVDKRVDVVVDELTELEASAEEKSIDLSQFEIAEFVTGEYYYMVYSDSPISQPLADIFDKRIEELLKSGWLDTVYEKWEVDMPEPIALLKNQ